MKMFCRTDQQCICYLCSVDEHRGHDTVSAAAERTERQKELEVRRQKIQERIQDKEKEVVVLQQEAEAIIGSADQAIEKSVKTFTELIRLMEEISFDVNQQIRSQQETELSRVKEIQEKLEQEISELRRKDAELEKLSHTEDHNQFIQNYSPLSKVSEAVESCIDKVHGLRYFEDVMAPVWDLRDELHHTLSEEWPDISLTASQVDVLLSHPEYKLQRAGFLKYSCKITLDPNTANTGLLLSEGNKRATRTSQKMDYSHHPDRFTDWWQVLSRDSLTGRCYWEVEWSGLAIYIAVVYDSITREGCSYKCGFGYNDKSWSLHCNNTCYSFRYDGVSSLISGPPSSRTGVYQDHRVGVLSFYSVSETMTLLHRVQTTFTQPLHVGLGLVRDGTTANFW
ncbi:tripartite motif-containing protein 16-like [Sphaeramia orbicularis]|uniref:tripartite motif-containing protein 16-like n=1 Tax=Sphaeramia orbicularis TaxID=375764 RepID=UPI00117E1068|nr:tripartite motif-containing protein 16-like [Sphaeramia orbicularis]